MPEASTEVVDDRIDERLSEGGDDPVCAPHGSHVAARWAQKR